MLGATQSTLFVVGCTAFLGSLKKYSEKLVDVKTAIYFLIPSLISIYFTKGIILPRIPNEIIKTENFLLTKDTFLLVLFAVVMLFSSISMIKNSKVEDVDCFAKIPDANANHFKTTIVALIVGCLTSLVGAGGGFLIIPTLIMLKEHCMRRAIGTSLIIITVNSFISFLTDAHIPVDWELIMKITGIALIGMLIGNMLTKKIPGRKLKLIFGITVLLLGIFIIIKELFL